MDEALSRADRANRVKTLRWPAAAAVFIIAALSLAAIANIRPDIPLETLKQRYAQPPSKFMQLGGLSVHYRDEGSGVPLVLLHGTGASLHTWQGWTAVLRRQMRVIRMDLPGFGLTGPEPSGDYSSARYVRFLEQVADQLGLQSFHLAGSSLGGLIAWRFAAAHPDRVGRLILLDAAGYPKEHPSLLVSRLAQVPVLSSLLERMNPRLLVARSLNQVYANPSKVTPELIDTLHGSGAAGWKPESIFGSRLRAGVGLHQPAWPNYLLDAHHVGAARLAVAGERRRALCPGDSAVESRHLR